MHVLVTEFALPYCGLNQAKILGYVHVGLAVRLEQMWDDAHKVGRQSSPACATVPHTGKD